jgi:hypothetical protein
LDVLCRKNNGKSDGNGNGDCDAWGEGDDIVGPALAGKAFEGTLQTDGGQTGLFPAEAGPTETRAPCGTGFSREAVDLQLMCS